METVSRWSKSVASCGTSRVRLRWEEGVSVLVTILKKSSGDHISVRNVVRRPRAGVFVFLGR